ncbi:CTP synthase [Candidatus Pacebacteria bacterium]|nr:CTP synthase [Candidatus Paceibacterota bacterium]
MTAANKKTKQNKQSVKKSPNKNNHKYIFVIGGVMSGVGKGISTASIGVILQSLGHKVNLMKVDPYLNVDAGTMNPVEHGETFVMNCGLETDQDMGTYERFLGRDLIREDYVTSGMVYQEVIEKERNLKYGGHCVEAVPHIRDEIVKRYKKSAKLNESDVTIVEIGGTVGDYQNIMFMEAARVLKVQNPKDVMFIMVSFLPIPKKLGEMKTKPTQNAIRQLNSYGIQADFIVARSEVPLDSRRKEKLAIQCNVPKGNVISAPDIDSIYDVPINFEKDKIGEMIADHLDISKKTPKLDKWKTFVKKTKNNSREINIAVVGKYFDTGDFVLSDSYLSVIEALKYSAYYQNVKPKLTWINSKTYDDDPKKVKELKNFDGVIVPGGFGETGIEGKMAAIKFVRENKIPYLGLCYGMQLMTIEYARNVVGLKGAQTAEIKEDAKHVIIDIMPDQKKKIEKGDFGGTMRLGEYPCYLRRGTIAQKAYGKSLISERHRHRYEVNPEYIAQLEDDGLVFSGTSKDKRLMEIAELPKKDHPFMLGTQFHPELKARPLDPHPLFTEFIKIAKKTNNKA